MRGVIVIGEGENDDTPMLYAGEHVGSGRGPLVDIAIDPVDGAGLTAKSLPNAMSPDRAGRSRGDVRPGSLSSTWTNSWSDRIWSMRSTSPPRSRTPWPPSPGCAASNVEDVTVALLDRPRHAELVSRIRAVGARIKFLIDGDLAGALMAVQPESEVDLLVGIGGSPEGVIAACAIRSLGGAIYGRLYARNDAEKRQARQPGPQPGTGADAPPTWCAATTSTSSRPASPTAKSFAASGTPRTRRSPIRCRCDRAAARSAPSRPSIDSVPRPWSRRSGVNRRPVARCRMTGHRDQRTDGAAPGRAGASDNGTAQSVAVLAARRPDRQEGQPPRSRQGRGRPRASRIPGGR